MSKGIKYTEHQLEFLRVGYCGLNTRDLTYVFNRAFGTNKPESAIRSTIRNHGITCNLKYKDSLFGRRRKFTPEQEDFIREHYVNHKLTDLTELFNLEFGFGVTVQQVRSFTRNHAIKSLRTGCFEKPLGSERVSSKDGFVLIKVTERNPYTGSPTRYKHKHVHVWEQHHGPVPDGMVVAFRDGDQLNCDPDNLMLISRAELLRLNQHGYKNTPAELKPSLLALARLETKTFTLGRGIGRHKPCATTIS